MFERIVDKNLLTRRLTITANHLLEETKVESSSCGEQLTIFDAPEDIAQKEADEAREKRMQKTLLDIKHRFGPNSIFKGNSFQDAATAKERNESIGGHKV